MEMSKMLINKGTSDGTFNQNEFNMLSIRQIYKKHKATYKITAINRILKEDITEDKN